MTVPITLTIAGSDSSGGAGIQADIKTFSALQTFGCSVITAITAQNTTDVQHITFLDPDIVIKQCSSVLADLSVTAIKIGMLGNTEIINALADYLSTLAIMPPVIIDPVMISSSGKALLENTAMEAFKRRLIPKAILITPNLYEAAVLSGRPVPENKSQMQGMLKSLLMLGSQTVLLKGGHLHSTQSSDLYFDGTNTRTLDKPMIKTRNTHGTGCSLSAAITAFYARGYAMEEAIVRAKDYVHEGLANADKLNIGQGHGPIHHFHAWWNRQ